MLCRHPRAHALARILAQEASDQLPRTPGEVRGELRGGREDEVTGFLLGWRGKRKGPNQHFEDEHAQRPVVDAEAVAAGPMNHLRSQVVQGPAQRPAPLLGTAMVNGPAKVGQLGTLAILREEDVLRLHVAMHHVQRVAVGDRARHLPREAGALAVLEAPGGVPGEELAEVPARGPLQDHVDARGIPEEAVEPHDAGVSQVPLDRQLPTHVALRPQSLHPPLLQHLERDDLFARPLPRKLHMSKRAAAKPRTQVEIREAPHARRAGIKRSNAFCGRGLQHSSHGHRRPRRRLCARSRSPRRLLGAGTAGFRHILRGTRRRGAAGESARGDWGRPRRGSAR
mmetsp:Transcript_98931/g.284189  ORF Transcript_98931/g.284189 Transcript_98931/m.284189 type:complete len:340 (+) Transcript_98931:141-1160(+)